MAKQTKTRNKPSQLDRIEKGQEKQTRTDAPQAISMSTHEEMLSLLPFKQIRDTKDRPMWAVDTDFINAINRPVFDQLNTQHDMLATLMSKLDAILKSPVEEVKPAWVVGGYVVRDGEPVEHGTPLGTIGVIEVVDAYSLFVRWSSGATKSCDIGYLRPATPEEIATYEQEKEASRKAEQEASKLSKLKFGVKVKTPRGEGIYWRSITHGRHAVVFDNGSEHYNLSDITIVG